MTLAELAELYAGTKAELTAAQALADENGDLEQRKAANEVERLQQKLARLEEKLARYPRGQGHPAGCACEVCRRLREARPVEERPVAYSIKLPPALKARLQELGSERVKAALEELAASRP